MFADNHSHINIQHNSINKKLILNNLQITESWPMKIISKEASPEHKDLLVTKQHMDWNNVSDWYSEAEELAHSLLIECLGSVNVSCVVIFIYKLNLSKLHYTACQD